MSVFVISDVHGKFEDLMDLIDQASPSSGDIVVQLGDLANCVADSKDGDLQCLEEVGASIDVMLIGNHEYPYFSSGYAFGGFRWFPEVKDKLDELYDDGFLMASFEHEGTLITHAGVSEMQLAFGMADAGITNDILNGEWSDGHFDHRLFSDIGWARGGPAQCGGILWCDFKDEMEPVHFPQIVGHTSSSTIRQKGNVLCIDAQGDIRKKHRTPSIIKLSGGRNVG